MGLLAEPINALADAFNNFISGVVDFFETLISYLDPTSDNFFLKLAFVPSDGFISGKFDELKAEFDDRLPIVGTLTELFDSIAGAQRPSVRSTTTPKFEIELPGKWGGRRVEIINFDVIDPYIPYVKTFIRFMIWIPFLIKIYKRLPQIIY